MMAESVGVRPDSKANFAEAIALKGRLAVSSVMWAYSVICFRVKWDSLSMICNRSKISSY